MHTAAAITATRKHLIEAHEALLTVTTTSDQAKQYIRETDFLGKTMTDADVLDELADDDIIHVRRMNIQTWQSEDITELCARKFLYAMDEREGVELGDEERFPAYVKNSKAWALWKDDLEASAPVLPDPDRLHDERRDHQLMGLEAAE
jgi:hypothetical protein